MRLKHWIVCLLLAFCIDAVGQSKVPRIVGTVLSIDNQPLSETDIVLEGFGSRKTDKHGLFSFEMLPPLRVGYPATFNIKGWIIIDPCVGSRGRIYLPDPNAERISIRVVQLSDSRRLSSESLECLLEGYSSQLPDLKPTNPCLPETARISSVLMESRIKAASELNVEPHTLDLAIREWSDSSDDLYKKALGAVYELDFWGATHYLSSSISATDPNRSTKLLVLARAQYESGNCAAAEANLRRILDFRSEDGQLLRVLALVVKAQGRDAEASALGVEAEAADEKLFGASAYEIGKAELANSRFDDAKSRFKDAKSHYLHALELDKSRLGNNEPTIAKDARYLGSINTKLKAFPEAEQYYRSAIAIDIRELETNPADVFTDRRFLAENLVVQGRDTEAAMELADMLNVEEKLRPLDLEVREDRNLLVSIYRRIGRRVDAESILEQVLQDDRRINFDKEAADADNLARMKCDDENYVQANTIYQGVWERARDGANKYNLTFLSVLYNAGVCNYKQQRFSEAESLYRQALEIAKKVNVPHDILAKINRNLSYSLDRLNRHSEAVFYRGQAEALEAH